MAMLLTMLCMSAVVFVLSLFCLKAAMTPVERRPELGKDHGLGMDARFFAGDVAAVPAAGMPREMLLMQIERHVRLEQAAAENFLEIPSHETLHSPSASQFVN